MSGILSAGGSVLSELAALTGSRSRLLPASFRGVPFYVVTSGGAGGRRLVTHQFPLRDDPYTEDLGKLPRRFKLQAFVIDSPDGADSYLDLRDALIDACEAFNVAATLVHPTFGAVSCRAGVLGWSEHIVEKFGYCEFQLDFVQDGPLPSPIFTTDAASALLAGVASILPLISAAYETLVLGLVSPVALLTSAAGAMLGLPPGTIGGLQSEIAAVYANPGSLPLTAAAVQTVTQSMASAVIAGQQPAPGLDPGDDPIAGDPFAIGPAADPSGGLATLAAWGSALPPVTGTTAVAASQAAMQAAIVALVQGNAVAALAQVYASIEWPYANVAEAARDQLLQLLDVQLDAAAAAGQDDLYRAWRALTALCMEQMIAEAQALPSLGPYAVADFVPSLVLAELLYLDASQAPNLEALNNVIQPLFMAPTGIAPVLPGSALVAPPQASPAAGPLPDYLTIEFVPLTINGQLMFMQ